MSLDYFHHFGMEYASTFVSLQRWLGQGAGLGGFSNSGTEASTTAAHGGPAELPGLFFFTYIAYFQYYMIFQVIYSIILHSMFL